MTAQKPIVYSGNIDAYISNPYTSPEGLKISKNPINELSYTANDMTGYGNWIKVGKATITVTMTDEKEIVTGMVEGIDKEIKNLQADTEYKLTTLRNKKQNLLAIVMDVSSK